MSAQDALTLSGAVLKAHYDWLLTHAETGANGQLYCKKNNEVIGVRVRHRYKLDSSEPDAPFVPDILLGDKSGSARMISFSIFWCQTCNDSPAVPDSVFRCDVVHLNKGVLEP